MNEKPGIEGEKKIAIGDVVRLVDGVRFVTDSGENVPIGSTLHFPKGFLVRQHDVNTGAGGYGHPPENFWTVTLTEQDGVLGILLPEGEEEYRTRAQGEATDRISHIHRESAFVPLNKIRDVSSAEVKALPSD